MSGSSYPGGVPPALLADDSEPFTLGSDQQLEEVESEGEKSEKDNLWSLMKTIRDLGATVLPYVKHTIDSEGGEPALLSDDPGTCDSDDQAETSTKPNCPALPSSDLLSCARDADILRNFAKPPKTLDSQLEHFHEIDLGGLIFVSAFVDMELQGLYEVVLHLEAVPKSETGIPEARLLGYIYYFIFTRTGLVEDLDKAIDMNMVAITGADAKKLAYFPCWKNIVVMLLKKYNCTHSLSDLEQAIFRAQGLGKLELWEGRQRDAELQDLIKMLKFRALENALEAILQDGDFEFVLRERQRVLFLCQLQVSVDVIERYMQNFEESNNAAALQLAISASEQFFAIDLSKGIEDPGFSYSLGRGALHYLILPIKTRYQQTNNPRDFQAAIDAYQAAFSYSSQEDKGILLYYQAFLFYDRFQNTGDLSDLQIAIDRSQGARELIPDCDERKNEVLHLLSALLLIRRGKIGSLKDCDAVVELKLQALENMPPNSQGLELMAKQLLAVSRHVQRYGRYDKSENVQKAIEAALEGSRSGSVARPSPNGLDDQRYDAQSHDQTLNNTLVDMHDFLTTPNYSQNLNLEELQTYIQKQTALRELLAANAQKKFRNWSSNFYQVPYALSSRKLAELFCQRYSKTNNREDLDEAIDRSREALMAVHEGHQLRGSFTLSHARFLEFRFGHRLNEEKCTDDKGSLGVLDSFLGILNDLASACRYYQEVALLSSAGISERILAAIHVSYLFMIGGNLDEAVRFAELSAKLFPLMPSRQLDQREQQIHIGKHSWVASCSASFTLFSGGGAYNAIRVLELGRGAITGLRLEMRSDLTELKLYHPEMAAQFEKFREILDSPLSISANPKFVDDNQTSSVDETRLQELRHRTNIELNKLIDQIRLLPNFGNFLLLPEEHQLRIAANSGPMIIINVSWFSSEAILIETASIRSIDLPKLNKSDLDKKIKVFKAALSTNGTSEILGILMWLWNVAAGPILDSLGFIAPPSEGNDWPHVWWIPTGKLSLLPIHAAGHHLGQNSTDTVIDRAISSYCSSIKSLLYSRQNDWQANPETGSVKSLLVAMDETPGHSSLRFVRDEIDMLQGLFHHPHPIESIRLDQPCRYDVLNSINDCSIFHFAGHGQSDAQDPSQSSLLTKDWANKPLTAEDLTKLDFRRNSSAPWLAYLSACSTGNNSAKKLYDEGLHLVTSFQLAGFRHVVGTLWEVSDEYCVDAAKAIYETILGREIGNDLGVALGVHKASRLLRDRAYLRDRQRHAAFEEEEEVRGKGKGRAQEDLRRVRPFGYPEPDKMEINSPLIWAAYVHVGA
ncbi:hypothetical protein AOL_s00006g494 [Orbilia oligospora ATCC 24927]|uniref:CHAT domain-containing protein n=1 Tax=Arthrobotrys oligospora (strain ATCC 24927 / CBS 115.81 / DSM 1491) TaxID=756982 RepID=G1X0U3_ARTOA|nr:hypothetical protein AOL_s00006g494 [Orbilia oligospora ATCC 24927]EGX53233.1 hypothetical protein AOL_s00006g494 [Orbilia oligospora ATCC 24927]